MRAALPALAAAVVALGCGGGGKSPDAAIRSTVGSYFGALGRADAKGACAQLSEPSREKLAEFGYDVLATGDKTCPSAYQRLFDSVAAPRLRRLGRNARVVRVARTGDRASVQVDGLGSLVKLVKAGDGWRIESAPEVEPDKLSGGKDAGGG
jgi:hypothetical protein